MPTSLDPTDHRAGFHTALSALVDYAEEAGLETDVPSCPDWTVRDLVAHQGGVHRWAAATLRGEDGSIDQFERRGRHHPDPISWLRVGATDLTTTLDLCSDDISAEAARVFLEDAPAAKPFWERRQCHETTIHAVDALAAAVGRLPDPSETWIGTELALDGIDELLLGFVPRAKSRLRSPEPAILAIQPDETTYGYLVRATADAPPAVTRVETLDGVEVTHAAQAPAVSLYLALWHRTELDSDLWPLWHDTGII